MVGSTKSLSQKGTTEVDRRIIRIGPRLGNGGGGVDSSMMSKVQPMELIRATRRTKRGNWGPELMMPVSLGLDKQHRRKKNKGTLEWIKNLYPKLEVS